MSYTESIDTSTAVGKMVFTMVAAVAEMERALIRERVQAGVDRAKRQGKKLGRPRALVDEEKIREEMADGGSIRATAKYRSAGVIVARAENVKNGRAHKIVLEAELAEIIERRWEARDYEASDGPAISLYVFHLEGRPVGDFRKAWASACKAAGFVKPKLDDNGEPVTITVKGKK